METVQKLWLGYVRLAFVEWLAFISALNSFVLIQNGHDLIPYLSQSLDDTTCMLDLCSVDLMKDFLSHRTKIVMFHSLADLPKSKPFFLKWYKVCSFSSWFLIVMYLTLIIL